MFLRFFSEKLIFANKFSRIISIQPNFRGRGDFMTPQWRHMKFNGTHFGYQWTEEVHTYTLVANIGVSGIPYRKSRGLQQPPFGGRVTKNTSGGRGLGLKDQFYRNEQGHPGKKGLLTIG